MQVQAPAKKIKIDANVVAWDVDDVVCTFKETKEAQTKGTKGSSGSDDNKHYYSFSFCASVKTTMINWPIFRNDCMCG